MGINMTVSVWFVFSVTFRDIEVRDSRAIEKESLTNFITDVMLIPKDPREIHVDADIIVFFFYLF